jgi:hypothetical protein
MEAFQRLVTMIWQGDTWAMEIVSGAALSVVALLALAL